MMWILLNQVSGPTFELSSSHKRIIFLPPSYSLDGRLHTVNVATVRR